MVPSGPRGRRTDERARRCHPHPGADEAVWGARSGPRHRPRRASRRDLRADRAGRRGEDLDVPDPRRRDGGDVRRRRAAGQPARRARAYVGYLTQVFSLYPDLSVAENLRYVGELRRVPEHEIERRGNRYLTMFGMERFTDRLAGRLSGGMKQKLALACALV